MSGRSWREWGEERKQRSLSVEFEDWKKLVREELEDMEDEYEYVYVIVNEWTPDGSEHDLREVVDSRFFYNHADAWERLSMVAEAFGHNLDPEEASFDLAPSKGIARQAYYIEELWTLE